MCLVGVKDEVISHIVYTVKQPPQKPLSHKTSTYCMFPGREDDVETHCTLLPIHFVHLVDIRAEVIHLSVKEQHRLSFLAQSYALRDAYLIRFLIDS